MIRTWSLVITNNFPIILNYIYKITLDRFLRIVSKEGLRNEDLIKLLMENI